MTEDGMNEGQRDIAATIIGPEHERVKVALQALESSLERDDRELIRRQIQDLERALGELVRSRPGLD